jgi:hypothetical protein
MAGADDGELLGVRWPELARFILDRARPDLARLGHAVIAANGLEDADWQAFHGRLVAAISARLDRQDRLQPLAASALSLLGEAGAMRAPIEDAAKAMLSLRLRGGSEADVLGPLHLGLRRALVAARRQLVGISAHEDRVWKRLDQLSRTFLADTGQAWASRCDWPFFTAFARFLKDHHRNDAGVVTKVESLAWYFQRHCPDCAERGFAVDADGNEQEPAPMPISSLPGFAAARDWLEDCLSGLGDEARAMVNVQFCLEGVVEMNAKAWRERNQVTRHRYERTVETALASLRACLEGRISDSLPEELRVQSSWVGLEHLMDDAGDDLP